MIAVDTNILIYAHRKDSPWHEPAFRQVRSLAEEQSPWAIPWPCLHEFLAIVTHPRVYSRPSLIAEAAEQIDEWMRSPGLVLLAESGGYWKVWRALLEASRVRGPQVHDARIAALCLHHRVRELWSADRDFGRFPGLKVRNPLIRN